MEKEPAPHEAHPVPEAAIRAAAEEASAALEPEDFVRPSIWRRWSLAFHDLLQSRRGGSHSRPLDIPGVPGAEEDDLSLRRARGISPTQMIVPEGANVAGALSNEGDTQVSGRVEGNVTVGGNLYIGPHAQIAGDVRAASCKVEGEVEGAIDCAQELELTATARLRSGAAAGRRVTIAGLVVGNVTTGGIMRLLRSGKIEGDVFAKQIFIEEGSKFNGRCVMRTPAPRNAR